MRFDLNSATSKVYAGCTIMHCHILAHEDQGAMGWADVVGGLAPPTFPQDASNYQVYYPLGVSTNPPLAPSSLTANTISSSQIDLSWVDNASDESTFEVERSTDGVNFAIVTTLSANVTNYSDNGLVASTTYYYRVRASSSNGSSAYTNTATAITSADTVGTTMLVDSITVTTVSVGQGNNRGRAVVIVRDDQSSFVEGAVVQGTFSGTFNETVLDSIPTDASGSTTIDTSGTAKGGISLTFCVDAIIPASGSTLEPYNGPQVCSSI